MTSDEREGFAAFLLRMRSRGIASKAQVSAFESTPRRHFVPQRWHDVIWSDRLLPIECGESLEGADLQAHVINALAIEPGNRVLEVGTGSAFTAAVMAQLGGRVVSLERYKTLVDLARERLEGLGVTGVSVRQADGSQGLAAEGPFDRIVAWVAFDALPRGFVDQLSSGGMMIAAIGPAEEPQLLTKLTKVGSRFERVDLGEVRMQPIIPGVAAVI